MKEFSKQLFSTIFFITLLMMSSCQAFQTSTPTTPEIQTEATDRITQRSTQTYPSQDTKEPNRTPTPTATPVIVSRPGTPLPSNLETIRVDNAERIQHLATWGIGSPKDIQLSKDGQVLAVGTGIGVYFYDTQGLYEIAFRKTPHSVISIAFSQDNEFIAVGQNGGIIDIFDRVDFTFANRLEVSELSPTEEYFFDCFFFEEVSKLIGIIRTNQRIIINQWSYGDWDHSTSFSFDNGLNSFINPDIGSIGVITETSLEFHSMFYVEDTKQIELPPTFSSGFWENFIDNNGDIAPTADGEGLLINDGSSIIYWEILSEEITYQLTDYKSSLPDPCQDVAETCLTDDGEISWLCQEKAPTPIETIALTTDDIMMLVSRNDESLELRRVHDGLLAWEVEARYSKIRLSPGSEFFFALREDGIIEKRESENGTLLGSIDRHPGKLFDIVFSPDGSEIAAGINNDWIQIYNAEDGQSRGVLEGNAHTLEYSPDGSLLAAGLLDGTIRLFTLDNGGHLDLEGHLDSVNDLKFSEDGRTLLSGSADCTISLWDINDLQRIQTIIPGKEEPFRVRRLAFSPVKEGQYLVGDDNSLVVASQEIKLALLPTIRLSDLTISQNEQTLAVCGGSTWLFREINKQAYSNAIKLTTQGQALTLNNDGSLLVVGTNNALEFWSVKNARIFHTIPLKEQGEAGFDPIRLGFSPDNTLIALGYQNGLIDIFGVPNN